VLVAAEVEVELPLTSVLVVVVESIAKLSMS
jgi:hypothetical protein